MTRYKKNTLVARQHPSVPVSPGHSVHSRQVSPSRIPQSTLID